MAEYAYMKKGWRTAIIVKDNLLIYFQNVADAFANRFQELGGKIVQREGFSSFDKTITNVVSRVNPTKADVICFVTGLVAHHRSFATSTIEPSEFTESSLYGPDEGNHRGLKPGFRSQIVFQASAIRPTAGSSSFCNAVVTSTPSKSATTCDGIIDVAVNSCA